MAGGSTDVKNERLPVDGFVIKRDSAVLNKPLINMMRGMYRDNKRDYPTVPAKTSWDEEIFTPKEVDMWGLQNLRAINNSSDNAAHNNIDELIAQSELAGMGHMQGYQKGDTVSEIPIDKLISSIWAGQYGSPTHQASSEIRSDLFPMIYGSLEDDKKQEFEKLVNPMLKSAGKYWLNQFNVEPEAKGYKKKFAEQSDVLREYLSGLKGYQEGDVVEKQGLLAGLLSMLSGSGRRQKRRQDAYEQMVPQDIGMQMPSATSPMPSRSVEQIPIEDIWERVDELAEKEAVKHYVRPPQPREFPSENIGADPHVRAYMDALNLGQQDVFDILEKRDPRRLNLLLYGDERGNPYSGLYGSYQKGDVVGYQQGEQVVDPNDPLGINERQAMGAQAYAGSTIAGAGGGVSVGDVAEAVEIDEMQKANQAMEALKLQGIYNEPERSGYFEFQGDVPQSEADQMRMVFSLLRDMENQKALNQLLMQTGRMGGQLKPREQGLFFKPK